VVGPFERGSFVRKSVWLWVLLAILAILVLGLIFGGYRKGEKLGEPAAPEPVAAGLVRTA
jgi:phosphate/sulfate permease